MPTLTIVDDYVFAAVKHARFELLDNGSVAATVPEAAGVFGFGATFPECLQDLAARLEEWVLLWSAQGQPLPVLDGLDLNTEESRALIAYHPGKAPVPAGAALR